MFSKWLGLINSQRADKDICETFHQELETRQDKFGVIAEFLGHRLFDKVRFAINPIGRTATNIFSFLAVKDD